VWDGAFEMKNAVWDKVFREPLPPTPSFMNRGADGEQCELGEAILARGVV
jgi:hypothetical protein